MLRAGVIGCGFIGMNAPDNHALAYAECPDVFFAAVCDKRKDVLAQSHPVNKEGKTYRKLFGHQYLDHLKMIKAEKLDIVSVCTPPHTHKSIVLNIAHFVKAIYCEKPIANTLEDADEMIKVCKENDTLLQINHQRRFTRPKFRFSRGISNTGTHAFDLIRHIFGEIVSLDKNTV